MILKDLVEHVREDIINLEEAKQGAFAATADILHYIEALPLLLIVKVSKSY